MDKITKYAKEDSAKEFLYVDDLVLLGDSWEETEMRYT